MNVRIDVSNLILETKRLILRAFQNRDLDDFYAYAKVDGVGEMAGWPHHKTKDVSAEILGKFIQEKKTFAIVDKESGKVIGSLGLERYDDEVFKSLASSRGLEIGYVLSKDYWGKGLMPEAVKEVIRYLFAEEGLDFIICCHFLTNLQSKRVIEKCGFQFYSLSTFEGAIGKKESATYIIRKEDVENGKF